MSSFEQKVETKPKSSSNGRGDEVAIFTDTNMGTHIAIAVSPHITTFDFQKELEMMHFSYFPKLGEVKACKVMVKRKAGFYCLPGSFLIKYAFLGLNKPWFLHVEMSPLSCSEKHIATECDHVHISDGHNVDNSVAGNTDMNDMVTTYKKKCLNTISVNPEEVLISCLEEKRMKQKHVGEFLVHKAGDLHKECHDARERSPGVKPVAVTIRKEKKIPSVVLSRSDISDSFNCFSAAVESKLEKQLEAKSEVNFSEHQMCLRSHFAVKTPAKNLRCMQPKYLTHRSSENELGMKIKVGRRILSAAHKLKVPGNKQRPSTYLFRGFLNASPGISSTFEISDNDD